MLEHGRAYKVDLPSLSYIVFFDQNTHDVNKKNSRELLLYFYDAVLHQ